MYSEDLISLNSVSNYHAVLVYPLYELKRTQVKVIVTFSRLYKRYPVFTVHGSVHRTNIPIYISNKMQRYTVYFIWKLLYMFWVVPPPIISSAYNCIYSIWYLSHHYCYLPL